MRIIVIECRGPGTTTMEPNDLDSKKPLLPDELMFPVEIITGALEDYPNFKLCLQKSSDSITLTPADRSKLHSELSRMKSELLAKQQLYQAQFDELKNWMKKSFEVDSPKVLLDHQTMIRDAELIAEEAATQGNSKQHQRIRALNSNNQAKKETSSSNNEPSSSSGAGRASKNLSRMNHVTSQSCDTGTSSAAAGGQGQKDLSAIKSKVPNQIPINVFWNYIEPFFKPIDEDDLKYLDDPSHVMDVAPFVIPPLGLHYEKIWYEQFGYLVPGGDNNKRGSRALNESNSRNQIHLRDRLLSALIDKDAEFFDDEETDDYDDEDEVLNNSYEDVTLTSVPLDDRLRSSLNELGFTDLTTSRDYQENDEICVEMRSVQRQLREQIVLNQYRKKRLAEFIRSKLASQEFYSLIGDLDKQIDGIFQKRVKSAKKKKTGKAPADTSSASNEISSEAIQCLENRDKLLDTFSEIVPGRLESLCPDKLIDFDARVEEQVIASAKKSSKWLPLPEIALKQPLSSCQPAFPNSRQ